jgi:motility quorum-sensing regulator / GCU-specific mRNA interferase toxin
MTVTARKDADRLGYLNADIVRVVDSISRKDFVKSMTAHFDDTRWQDVYNVRDGDYLLYVKFTDHMVTAFVVLSFKEK